MLTSRYFHVTEREDAADILENGFLGGWGDVGFGIYAYGSCDLAEDYAAKGGWDGRLKDPVILMIEDPSFESVIPHPTWDVALYEQMVWRSLEDQDEDEYWKPERVTLVEAPDSPALNAEASEKSDARRRRSPR